MLALAMSVWVLAAAPGKDVQRGAELFEQFKYAEARAAFARARAAGNLTRAELLGLLELTGVAAALQRQPEAAQSAFVELLTLAPEHQLKNDYAPRVMTPFYEARRLVQERGALAASTAARATAGALEAITVVVERDPLKQVRAVRFHARSGEGWTTADGPPAGSTFPVSGAQVSFWVELLGDGGSQLLLLGAPDSPRVETAPARASVAAPLPADAPPAAQPAVEARRGGGGARTASYLVLALALAAGGTGGYFGWRSSADFARITSAPMNGDGVLAISEHDAHVFAAHGQQSALIANTLFASAGALALTAALMWLLGGP